MIVASYPQRPVDPSIEWVNGVLPVVQYAWNLVGSEGGSEGAQVGSAAIVDFLDTGAEPARLLSFARSYGYLGVAETVDEPLHVCGTHTRHVEHLESWQDMHALLSWASASWAAAQSGNARSYVGIKNYSGTTARERLALGEAEANAASGVLLAVDVPLKRLSWFPRSTFRHTRWYPDRTVDSSIPVTTDLADEDFADFLRESVLALVNRMLKGATSAHLVEANRKRNPEIRLIPTSLAGQMWLEMMQRCSGERRFIKCQGCGRHVDVTSSRKTRKYCHDPRGVNCRQAYQRGKRV